MSIKIRNGEDEKEKGRSKSGMNTMTKKIIIKIDNGEDEKRKEDQNQE
jgi:hypothetical protein